MASFKTHFVAAALSSGALSSAFLTLEMLSNKEAMVAFAIGTLGGLAPDIDADNSKPLNIAFTVIAIIISFFTMFAQVGRLSIIEMLVFWLLVFFFVRFVVMLVFQMLTKHRGIFHSIPMAIFLSELTILIFYYLYQSAASASYIYGFFFFFGYLIHFILDELVSVNLFGLHIKRSLGSAMKLFDTQTPFLYLLLYFSVISVVFFLPSFETTAKELVKLNNFFSIWFPQEGFFQNIF